MKPEALEQENVTAKKRKCNVFEFQKDKQKLEADDKAIPTVSVTNTVALKGLDASQFLWFKKPLGSNIQYKVLGIDRIPGIQYFARIEMPINDGFVCGTSICFTDLFQDELQPLSVIDHVHPTLASHFSRHVFQVIPDSFSDDVFNVNVICQNDRLFSSSVMTMVSELHWKRIVDMTKASRYFLNVLSTHNLSTNDSLNLGRMAIAASSEHLWKTINRGIESLEAYQEVSMEDQLIVLKEAVFSVGLLSFSHHFVKNDNSFVFTSSLGLHLLFCIPLDSKMKEFNGRLHEMYIIFLTGFPDYLRQDLVIITILSLLCIYSNESGLNCASVFERERRLHLEILDKYIDGKINTNQWLMDKEDIMNDVDKTIELIVKCKAIYFECINTLYSIEYRAAVSHEASVS